MNEPRLIDSTVTLFSHQVPQISWNPTLSPVFPLSEHHLLVKGDSLINYPRKPLLLERSSQQPRKGLEVSFHTLTLTRRHLWPSEVLSSFHRAAVCVQAWLLSDGNKWSQKPPHCEILLHSRRAVWESDWQPKINWVCVGKCLMRQGQPLLCVSFKEDVGSGVRRLWRAASGSEWQQLREGSGLWSKTSTSVNDPGLWWYATAMCVLFSWHSNGWTVPHLNHPSATRGELPITNQGFNVYLNTVVKRFLSPQRFEAFVVTSQWGAVNTMHGGCLKIYTSKWVY